jgi:hypothetical protein
MQGPNGLKWLGSLVERMGSLGVNRRVLGVIRRALVVEYKRV